MKLLKNRIFIGVLCIAIALLLSFVAVPAMQKESKSAYVNVVRMKTAVQEGTQISEGMVEAVKVPEGLVQEVISDTSSVLGRYVNTDLYAGDYLAADKLSDTLEETDKLAAGITKDKMVVSVTLPSLASGVSGQLLPGDIVTVMALPENTVNQTLGLEPETVDTDDSSGAMIYPELQYLEVCSVTAVDGSDAHVSAQLSDEEENALPVTVSFFADETQALLLAELEQQGTIYLAFVARGEATAAYIPNEQRVFNLEVE